MIKYVDVMKSDMKLARVSHEVTGDQGDQGDLPQIVRREREGEEEENIQYIFKHV